jgi:hypothetical protein
MGFYIYFDKKEGWQVEIQAEDDYWFFKKTVDFQTWYSGMIIGTWEDSWEYKLMFDDLSEEFLIDNIDYVIPFWLIVNKKISEDVKNRILNLKNMLESG